MLLKTLDAEYGFWGMWEDLSGTCRLRIYEDASPQKRLPTVAIFSPVPKRRVLFPFMDLAVEAMRLQRARRQLGPDDPRHAFLWFVHYPAGTLRQAKGETFCRAFFTELPDGTFGSIEWKDATRRCVEALIGQAFTQT